MSSVFPEIYLVRHGETAWSASGKHTGRTDMPLTAAGEDAARQLAGRLQGISFAAVWSSPSQRAFNTSRARRFRLGLPEEARPGRVGLWRLRGTDHQGRSSLSARDGVFSATAAPQGESAADAGARADRIVGELRQADGSVLVFSSAHFLRVLAARWVGSPPEDGAHFVLDTASISILGYEHDLTEPVVRRWNQRQAPAESCDRR